MGSTSATDFNFDWFRTFLLDDLLPHWLRHAVTDEGLFLTQLDRRWRPLGEQFGTAVSQTRLLYNFSVGYDLTGDDRYLRAVDSGARFLLDKFRDPKYGGWFHSVGPGGAVIDDHKNAYDFAFIIFGLAHAFRVTRGDVFRAGMIEAWDILDTRFRDEHGGIIRVMTRDFRPNEERRTQNPTMHLFEALLAAGDVEPGMLGEAETLGKFVLSRLVRWRGQPCLPEYYDLDWNELPRERGGSVCIGHQFEWAYLLSAAVERGLPGWWISPATDLLQFGLRVGYDREDGGIIGATTPRGEVVSAGKGWWEQCEAIRAMMRHAVLHGRDDLWAPLGRTVGFVKEHYVDETYGGWHSSIESEPTGERPPKGGGAKVDYHVVGMCAEAVRLQTSPSLD